MFFVSVVKENRSVDLFGIPQINFLCSLSIFICSSASFLISIGVFFLEAMIHLFSSVLLKYNLLPGLLTGISCLLTFVYMAGTVTFRNSAAS